MFDLAAFIAIGAVAVKGDYCKLCSNHVACPEDTVSIRESTIPIHQAFHSIFSMRFFSAFRHRIRIVREFRKLPRRWKISFWMNTINWEIKLQPVKLQASSQLSEWQLWFVHNFACFPTVLYYSCEFSAMGRWARLLGLLQQQKMLVRPR